MKLDKRDLEYIKCLMGNKYDPDYYLQYRLQRIPTTTPLPTNGKRVKLKRRGDSGSFGDLD